MNAARCCSLACWLLSALYVLPSASFAAEDASHSHAPSTRESVVSSSGLRVERVTRSATDELWRVITLRDYNTRVVLLGSTILGISAGVVGVFLLLRRRALLGDVVSHATLPGMALAFLVMERMQAGSGRSLMGLLIGAAAGGVVGALCATAIRRWTRIKDDAALAVVLSVFYGLGIALLSVVQAIPSGSTAGLKNFIYGKAASMMADDVRLIGGAAALMLLLCALLYKELAVVAFDERFAAAEGWPVFRLDVALMGLVVVVTVVGLQSVGLLLVVALLIIPPAAARFWTERLGPMLWISGGLGGLSAAGGVVISAVYPRIATGATIVLAGTLCFLFSLLAGTQRGIVLRTWQLWHLRRRTGRQHLLRAIYERLAGDREVISAEELTRRHLSSRELQSMRSWTPRQLQRLLAGAERARLIIADNGTFHLSPEGAELARQVVRNHRLWELYLIHYAHIAPSHVDRDADDIEHMLDGEMLAMLEERLGQEYPEPPPSPHGISTTISPAESDVATVGGGTGDDR